MDEMRLWGILFKEAVGSALQSPNRMSNRWGNSLANVILPFPPQNQVNLLQIPRMVL